MSGGNQIAKYAKVDRNNYLSPLQYIGTPFQLIDPPPFDVVTNTIPTTTILNDILVDAGSPNAITVTGTAAGVGAILSVTSLNHIGERWTMGITNNDAVSKVITLPTGFVPATITVPPGFSQYTFQVDSTSPEVISLILTTGAAAAGAVAGVTSFNGRTGPVVSVPGDYTDAQITNTTTVPGAHVFDTITFLENQYNTATVQSFNGRVGPVVPALGDYTSTTVTNLSTVAGPDVTTALNNLKAQSGVTSFTGAQGFTRTGPIVAQPGDYGTDNITNQSTVPGGTDTQALNNLLTDVNNKVTLGNAITAGDLLVATAAGDNYVPSVTTLGFPAHCSCIQVGQLGQIGETINGAVIEARADGAAPSSSLIRATLGPAGSTINNFCCIFADPSNYPNFGQTGVAQSGHRVILPIGLPPATGAGAGAGAYAFVLDVGNQKPFFVNAVGNVKIVPSGAAAATTALGLDANGMICII